MKTILFTILLSFGAAQCSDTLVCFHDAPLKYKKACRAALVRKGIVFREVRASIFETGVIHFCWIESAIHFTSYGPPLEPVQGDYFVGNSEIIWLEAVGGGTIITACADTWKKYCTADMIDYEIRLATEK